jgi:hypothetical protein
MSDTYTPTHRPEPQRDHWGRPYVVPPTGGKAIPYTRTTTYVGAIEDMYKLGLWQQRHVARGVAFHDDLIAAIRDTDAEDRENMDRLADEAKERSGAGDAARHGTYLHAVTEAADRGEDVTEVERPWQSYGQLDEGAYVTDLAAYREATRDLKCISIEQFLVQDPLKVAGTADRVVMYEGKRFIADLKTGSIEYGALKIAAQLAMYARSRPYDFERHERLDPHGCEVDRGIIIHLPAGTGTCHLYWVDLLQGWEAVRACRDVRKMRQVRFPQLTRQLAPLGAAPVTLADQIKLCASRDAVVALWNAHEHEWTDDLTDLAKRHITAIEGKTA